MPSPEGVTSMSTKQVLRSEEADVMQRSEKCHRKCPSSGPAESHPVAGVPQANCAALWCGDDILILTSDGLRDKRDEGVRNCEWLGRLAQVYAISSLVPASKGARRKVTEPDTEKR
jgi:hypothetical protein